METAQQKPSKAGGGGVSSWKIFVGFAVGTILGLVFNVLKKNPIFESSITWLIDYAFYPLGNAFLQSLFMIIVPLVAASLIKGVADLGSGKSLGRLSKRLFLFYAFSTFLAISVGQVFVNSLQPGRFVTKEQAESAAEEMKDKLSSVQGQSSLVGASLWPGIVTKTIPKNIIDQFSKTNMLAVIFVSLLFGAALLRLPKGLHKDSFTGFMAAVSHLSIIIIGWIMKTAPVAVAALLTTAVSTFGLSLIKSVGMFVIVISLGLLSHLFISYGLILKFLIRIPVKEFFKRMFSVLTTAFSLSSSNATMPVTMNTLEKKFGLPRSIVNFSVPIGTIVNMDGTALFEVAAAIFIAQIYGVELSLLGHFSLVTIVFITSIGIAGVPGGSIPILMAAMVTLGIPAEGLALIIGVDRLLDMSRTTVNVTGDSLAALFLCRMEGMDLRQKLKDIPA